MNEQKCKQLDKQGYLVFRNVLSLAQVELPPSANVNYWV